jgi:nucleotide-binding universal stress UspA family protein
LTPTKIFALVYNLEKGEYMYKKIVVPLDGSQLAECVLPHVETVVKGCELPEVLFLQVIEPPPEPFTYRYVSEEERQKFITEDTAEARKAAAAYLDGIAKSTNFGGVRVHSDIILGKPADVIAEYATKEGADLVVIATHGRSGVSRWALGSVADRILRSSCMPVLMVRAPGCAAGI